MKRSPNGIVYYCSDCKLYFRDGIQLKKSEIRAIGNNYALGPCDKCITRNSEKANKRFDKLMSECLQPFTCRHQTKVRQII